MKKIAIPSLLALSVFAVTLFFQGFTLLRQEELGLFLNTPDYYRALFFDRFPLSHLVGGFLVQFYDNVYVGSAIVAAMILLIYFLASAIAVSLGAKPKSVAVAVSCIFWIVIARAEGPATGVAAILMMTAFLVSVKAAIRVLLAVRPGCTAPAAAPADTAGESVPTGRQHKWSRTVVVDTVAAVLLISSTAAFLIASPSIRTAEKWSKIEIAAIRGNWDFLLKVVTPEEAGKDIQTTPFALLALNAQGRLSAEMYKYPVSEDYGLDYGNEISYRRSLFDAVLYCTLGCHNEAIHRIHQCGNFLPCGTSFRTLRMLVAENYAIGDSLLVVKYCDILDKSCTHGGFTARYRNNPCPMRQPDTAAESAAAPLVVTTDPMENLRQMGQAGISSLMTMDRYYSYHLLKFTR